MNFRQTLFILLTVVSISVFGQQGFKAGSVLSTGKWYKVKISETGVYRISYSELKSIGFETPENIRIYAGNSRQLSEKVNDAFVDDLEELSIYSSNDTDFGSDDYYLFYAEGVKGMYYNATDQSFKQDVHDYALANYYFLTTSFGPGKRIETLSGAGLNPDFTQSTYDWIDFYEEEKINLINSGRLWFGDQIAGDNLTKQFVAKNYVSGHPVLVETMVAVRSEYSQTVEVYANGSFLSRMNFTPVNINDVEATYARSSATSTEFVSNSEQLNINFRFSASDPNSLSYVDYIRMHTRCQLIIEGDEFYFRDRETVGEGNITRFNLQNATSGHQVWDITSPTEIVKLNSTLNGTQLSLTAESSELREYLVVKNSGSFPSPIFADTKLQDVGWVANQNIHAMEMPAFLIVTHPAFLKQAEQLADIHRTKDEMSVEVVTTQQVYNEFSSGKPDAAAIRNLARMFYEKSTASDSLKYLLLFGDGSFDNRTLNGINPSYIPTFQSVSSLDPTSSYVADDFYAFLGPGEGGIVGKLDIGVGRFPVNSDGKDELEAQTLVNKIEEYYAAANMTDWLNRMLFLGDDGESGWDNIVFMSDSDGLAKIVEQEAPAVNIYKIYLDAYKQTSSSTGASYPEVELLLQDSFNKGMLIFNYMGHGGENGITQEQVLKKTDFENLKNAPYYPLFITATCQLSRYDNVSITAGTQYARRVSAGEAALLNPDGGAIALLTTTRLVYQSSNKLLSEALYRNVFRKDYQGNPYRLGDILRHSKNNTSASKENTLKFTLLGDPALRLMYGEHKVLVDSINGFSVNNFSDTVNALEEVFVSGRVTSDDSTLMNEFNGIVYINVFDKAYLVTTNGNDGIEKIDFSLQDRLLFRGKASVSNGKFRLNFKIPKDIVYNFGTGRLSFYAENGQLDAKGEYSDFIIGGTSDNPEIDMDGPEISLFMNDWAFVDGGVTDANPLLLASLYDQNGINTTGIGIGHDLVALLDEDYSRSYMLNDNFESELDDYQRGTVRYPLSDLDGGQHTISLKVWDIYNNSSYETLNFYVESSPNTIVNTLVNFPNPATMQTTFQYTHNKAGQEHRVNIDIYDISGRMVHQLQRNNNETGFVSEPITWNIKSNGINKIEPGVYPYKLRVSTSDGSEGIKTGSLIIIP
ncbi:MAG: type IX secretion system sortase PorU [Bacteroidota bacterium]|nr:MAG: type IX secretion system sortase PorU [Bacteroidota bacterium]